MSLADRITAAPTARAASGSASSPRLLNLTAANEVAMTARDGSLVAWHEGAHAIVAARRRIGIAFVEIDARGTGLMQPVDLLAVDRVDHAAMLIAGAFGEALREQRDWVDWRSEGLAGDLDRLAALGITLSSDGTMTSARYATAAAIAWGILKADEQLLDELATQLDVYGRMTGDQVGAVVRQHDDAALEREASARRSERVAFMQSPLGRRYNAANQRAWEQAGRPGESARFVLDHWNYESSTYEADGARRVLWSPPHPIPL